MKLQDLRDNYKSKTAKERYDYYRTLPLDEKDLFGDTLLDIALNFADVEALKILLERNVDVNEINRNGNRPLHNLILSSEYKNLDDVLTCIELLLDNGASVLKKNDMGETPVLSAIRGNYIEILELFVMRNLKLDLKDSYGNGPLHIAAYSCNSNNEEKKKKIFKLLLDAGIENDIKNDDGYTPIDILANQRVNPILFSILKGEYDFDNPNSTSNLTSAMSLHSAILSSNYDVIKAHLEVGTDINEISEENNNSYGLSPLGVACHILDFESVELLLKNGADPNLKNNDGETALSCWFKWNGSIYFTTDKSTENTVNKIMSLLLEYGLDINDTIDNQSNNLLIKASEYLSISSISNGKSIPSEVIKFLLKNKVNINLANIEGQTTLMILCKTVYRDGIDYIIELLENGADVGSIDKNGYTVLMYAISNDESGVALEIAKLLYDFGDIKISYVNNGGQSAMDIAVENNNENLVNWLLTKI